MLSADASGVVPVGVRPPPSLQGSPPCETGQFIPAGFDCGHSSARNFASLNFFILICSQTKIYLFGDFSISPFSRLVRISAEFRRFFHGFCVNLYKEYTSLKSRELEELPRFGGNDLATVLIAVVCIALLVRVTLTDANVHK